MSWSRLTLMTDAELGQLEPEATASAAPWGVTTWANQRTEAKRDLKIWLERDFTEIPGVADRVLDRWVAEWVKQYTGSAYTDRTDEARDDTEEDVPLASVFATPASDRLYIGAVWEFEGLFVKLLDSVNANASVLTANYWGDNQWESLSATDGTIVSGATCGKSGRVTWTIPSDWERRRLDGTADEYFWVELSVSAALTAGTAATQIVPIRMPDGLKRVGHYLALHYIFKGLAAQAAVPEGWLTRAQEYWDRATALYGDLRAHGGVPLDISRSEAIVEEEARVVSPVRLYRA